MNAVERYRIRRAAFVLGVPVPAYAALRYTKGRVPRYSIETDHDGVPTFVDQNDISCIRRLAKENGVALPAWAAYAKPGPKPRTSGKRSVASL